MGLQQMERQKEVYDRKAKAAHFDIGDRVLVKVLAFEGKHKIQDRFEDDIYIVIEQPNERIPVYRVRSERTDVVRTLHRNHLFPIGDRKMLKPVPKKRRSLEKVVDVATEEIIRDVEEERDEKERRDEGFETRRRRDDSDDESDDGDDGTGIVVDTNHHGDAHESIEVDNSERDESVEENADKGSTEKDGSSESFLQEGIEESEEAAEDDSEEQVAECQEEDRVEESHDDPIEVQQDHNHKKKEGEVPTPIPRRSQRERRAPKRFDSYHMSQMVSQTRHDSRMEALHVLTSSGVLECIDRDVAYSILDLINK